jgi:hypothetical protein
MGIDGRVGTHSIVEPQFSKALGRMFSHILPRNGGKYGNRIIQKNVTTRGVCNVKLRHNNA